jgi:DNA-binding MarR family transcriptional regulator
MAIPYDSSGLLSLAQHLRRLDWSKAIPGMTQAEYLALSVVRRTQEAQPDSPGVYVSTLAEELMISVSMVSKMLKVLEDRGWIRRTVDMNSRRNTFVSLTDLGLQVHDSASHCLTQVHEKVAQQVGQETLDQLSSSAARLFRCYEDVLSAL